MLNNKIICSEILKHYVKVPDTYLMKSRGKLSTYGEKVKTYKDVYNLLKEKKKLFFKAIAAGKGKGIYRFEYKENEIYIDNDKYTKEDFLKFLKTNNNWLISECMEQHPYLNGLYDQTTNTIRFITFKDIETKEFKIFFAVQRIGTSETIPVDNGSRGGLTAKIDLDTGELSYAQSLWSTEKHPVHPDTGAPIERVKVPDWDKIKKEMLELANQFPFLTFVAWDILLTKEGISIIEANTSSGVNIIQLWGGQRNGELGDFYRHYGIIKKEKKDDAIYKEVFKRDKVNNCLVE